MALMVGGGVTTWAGEGGLVVRYLGMDGRFCGFARAASGFLGGLCILHIAENVCICPMIN